MTAQELLNKATTFLIWSLDDHGTSSYDITVELRSTNRWAICYGRSCWDIRENEFIYESMPSGRTEDYIKNTRFSLDEALKLAEEIIKPYEQARLETIDDISQFPFVLNKLLNRKR